MNRSLSMVLLCGLTAAGCSISTGDADEVDTNEDSLTSNDAPRLWAQIQAASLRRNAPDALPADAPETLTKFAVTDANGASVDVDLPEALKVDCRSRRRPCAEIVGAFRTTPTPANAIALTSAGVPPVYELGGPAIQLYECRANAAGAMAWTFVRPEAGLTPITKRRTSTRSLQLDHFRYPGASLPSGAALPAGPAWRITAPRVDDAHGVPLQDTFIGVLDAQASGGDGNIALLRVRRAGRDGNGFPHSVVDGADYVFRLGTRGGLAPSTGCSAPADAGKITRSPYETEYYFVRVETAAGGPARR